MKATRRKFLKSSVIAGAGLVLAVECGLPATAETAMEFSPNAFIQIRPDNIVCIWVTRSEMGQGVRTTLPMMLADELEADWAQITLEQAPTIPRFKGIRLRTSGSGSTEGTYNVMRKAGATARTMLIAAAAEKWGVEPGACQARSGFVSHSTSGRKLSYGALAEAASHQAVPENPHVKRSKGLPIHRQTDEAD